MKKLSLLFLCQLVISITQAQNVGIGTTQPAAQLHLASIDLGDTARGSIIMSRYWLNSTDTRASAIYHLASTANAKDKLVVGVSGEGGSYSSPLLYSNAKMVIQADGNVGIGMNNPVNKLSVVGHANFTGYVAIGAMTPDVSAALDISSTNKGFLPPRMTSVQRDAIPGAVAGLIVWCANCGVTGELNVYNGTAWTNMIGNPVTPPQVPPTVITTAISGITSTSAVSGGNVTSDGYSAVTARGVCWDIATNPTVALPTKTNNGTGTGSFVSNITGLTPGTTYYVRAYATNAVGASYGAEFSFTTGPFAPTVITTAISAITSTSAVSGGNVTSDGNSAVTVRGVCWDIATNPTVALSTKTTNGAGTGSFVSNITGLTPGTTYYVRAYATNAVGTSYGGEISFTSSLTAPGIGNSYQGGIVAYILQPGDPGYIAGQTHGLIAAASDQSTDAEWGCYPTAMPGADGTVLGTGNQNTIDIMAGCATAGIAARLCGDLALNGYSDWYLPSKDELNKLYINRVAVGGFNISTYWSSSEIDNTYAWSQLFGNGNQFVDFKDYNFRVRAVRAF